MGRAQRRDEALFKLFQWIERGKVPRPRELQGFSRLAWQLNNQINSLQLLQGFWCGKNEIDYDEVVLQRIIPSSLTHKIS